MTNQIDSARARLQHAQALNDLRSEKVLKLSREMNQFLERYITENKTSSIDVIMALSLTHNSVCAASLNDSADQEFYDLKVSIEGDLRIAEEKLGICFQGWIHELAIMSAHLNHFASKIMKYHVLTQVALSDGGAN